VAAFLGVCYPYKYNVKQRSYALNPQHQQRTPSCAAAETAIIDLNQHGFFPGRSTCTQLLDSQYELCTVLDSNIVSDVILIDFSKATLRLTAS
jgi:hypothetical protein